MTGFRRVGARHKELVETFLRRHYAGRQSAAAHALSSAATITLGDSDPLDIAELVAQLDGANWAKMSVRGPRSRSRSTPVTVAASCSPTWPGGAMRSTDPLLSRLMLVPAPVATIHVVQLFPQRRVRMAVQRGAATNR